MDKRQQALESWLATLKPLSKSFSLKKLAGDASFRRYFRINTDADNFIVMDAPPAIEPCDNFVAIASAYKTANLQVPEIIAQDIQQGFLLLGDFGDELYLDKLNTDNADQLYQQALDELIIIQSIQTVAHCSLPLFDEIFIAKELQNCQHWLFDQYLACKFTQAEQQTVQQCLDILIKNAIEQPQVGVHRDYHSRNLMVLASEKTGILDFQDAVIGPITYDAVSLLRDCYIDWPKERVCQWINDFQELLVDKNRLSASVSKQQFLRWFDLMGIQRHLKAAFIFARKFIRDKNSAYLAYLPRTLGYIQQISANYDDLNDFHQLFTRKIIPTFKQKQAGETKK